MHGQKHKKKKKTNTASLFRDMYNILTRLKKLQRCKDGIKIQAYSLWLDVS